MVTWLSQCVAMCHQVCLMFIGVSCVLMFVSFGEGLALCVCISMCEQLSASCVYLQAFAQVCVRRDPWSKAGHLFMQSVTICQVPSPRGAMLGMSSAQCPGLVLTELTV